VAYFLRFLGFLRFLRFLGFLRFLRFRRFLGFLRFLRFLRFLPLFSCRQALHSASFTGATGFDVGRETPCACRGARYLVKPLANH
jgi:hypothetical protein